MDKSIRREMMILQMPEAMEDPPPINDGHLTDGNRIDLTLFPIAKLHEFQRESLSLLLLDKDGPYVAKGLWREEIIYAKYMLDQVVREQLMKMLTWHVGVKTQFLRNPGKFGEHLKQDLEPELWAMLEKTNSDASYDNTWQALYRMCDLFRITATRVAGHFGFDCPGSDDEKVSAHLKQVRSLLKNAKEMY